METEPTRDVHFLGDPSPRGSDRRAPEPGARRTGERAGGPGGLRRRRGARISSSQRPLPPPRATLDPSTWASQAARSAEGWGSAPGSRGGASRRLERPGAPTTTGVSTMATASATTTTTATRTVRMRPGNVPGAPDHSRPPGGSHAPPCVRCALGDRRRPATSPKPGDEDVVWDTESWRTSWTLLKWADGRRARAGAHMLGH